MEIRSAENNVENRIRSDTMLFNNLRFANKSIKPVHFRRLEFIAKHWRCT